MYSVEADKSQNVLRIAYQGQVGPEETKRCLAQLEPLIPRMGEGFSLLTDLTGLQSMDLACVAHIKRVMDICNQRGVGLVVRVIPDPHKDIGFSILSLFHYDRHVRIVTCQTSEEARKVLAG